MNAITPSPSTDNPLLDARDGNNNKNSNSPAYHAWTRSPNQNPFFTDEEHMRGVAVIPASQHPHTALLSEPINGDDWRDASNAGQIQRSRSGTVISKRSTSGDEEVNHRDGCCGNTFQWLFVEWRIHLLIALLACAVTVLALLVEDVIDMSHDKEMSRIGTLALQVSEVGMSTGMLCAAANIDGSVVVIPESEISSIRKEINKLMKSSKQQLNDLLDAAVSHLEKKECQLAVESFSTLFAYLSKATTQRLIARSSMVSNLAYVFSLAWSQLRSEGILRLQENKPVTSDRAIQGISSNLICSPITASYISTVYGPVASDIMNCQEEAVTGLLPQVPIVEPSISQLMAMGPVHSFLSSSWMNMNSFKVDYKFYVTDFSHFAVICIVSITGIVLLLINTLNRRRFTREQRIVKQDFALEDKAVAVKASTLRVLDYYCWKLGSFEEIDLSAAEVCVAGGDPFDGATAAGGGGAEQQGFKDAFFSISGPGAMTAPGQASPMHRSGDPADAAGGRLQIDSGMAAAADIASAHRGVACYLSHPETHMALMYQFKGESMKLTEATQMQLRIHQAVHPLLLVKPFIPDYMMKPLQYDVDGMARLGPSVLEKKFSVNLQEGLEATRATYLFFSFRSFNFSEALVTAQQHYSLREEQLRRQREEVTEYDKKKDGCCSGLCGGGRHDSAGSADAADVVIVHDGEQWDSNNSMHSMGKTFGATQCDDLKYRQRRYEAEHRGSTNSQVSYNPLSAHGSEGGGVGEDSSSTPLSPVAAALNYSLACIRYAASLYGGELVQISSDGALVQFRTGRDAEKMSAALRSSSVVEHMREPSICSLMSSTTKDAEGSLVIGGQTYHIRAEERAARAALLIQECLENYMDFPENRLVPQEMLYCPIVISKDTTSMRGRVGFHVSKHYSILSHCIPLMFPLEQICREYGIRIIVTHDVHQHIQEGCLTRPIHYMEMRNLHYYCFTSVAEKEEEEEEEADAASAPSSASPQRSDVASTKVAGSPHGGVGSASSTPKKSGSATTTPAKANMQSSGEKTLMSPPSTMSQKAKVQQKYRGSSPHAGKKNLFGNIGIVYELASARALNTESQAYRIFVDEESRTRARRDHWRLLWTKYEMVLSQRQHLKFLRKYLNDRKQEQDMALIQSMEAAIDQDEAALAGTKTRAEALATGLEIGGSNYEGFSAVGSMSTAGPHFSQGQEQSVQLLKGTIETLKDCYHELSAYEHIYGLQRQEVFPYEKMKAAILAMLAMLDVTEDDIEDTYY